MVTREASRDPYDNGESQHETEVEPDSAAFGKTVVAVFQVGRVFDGGARNIGYAVSRDSGRTWRRGFLPGLTPRASDPSIAYDRKHRSGSRSRSSSAPTARRSPSTARADTRALERAGDGRSSTSPSSARTRSGSPATTGRRARTTATATSATATRSARRWSRRPRATAASRGRALTSRAGLPGPRLDPRLLRAGRAAARAAERPRRDRLLRRGQDLGAALGRRRRDLDAAGRDRAGGLPHPHRACARRRCRPRRSARTAAPTSPGPTAPSGRAARRTTSSTPRRRTGSPGRPPPRVPTGSGDAELPGLDADPTRPGASRSPTTSTAARRSTSASSGRRTPARAGAAAAAELAHGAGERDRAAPRSARWSATTSRPRSPAAGRCRSSCSPSAPRHGLHEAAFGTSIAVP